MPIHVRTHTDTGTKGTGTQKPGFLIVEAG